MKYKLEKPNTMQSESAASWQATEFLRKAKHKSGKKRLGNQPLSQRAALAKGHYRNRPLSQKVRYCKKPLSQKCTTQAVMAKGH